MYAIHEELARSQQSERQRAAEAERLAVRLVLARRWARKAEAAGRRARSAARAVAELA